MKKPFSERFEKNNKDTLRYDLNELKRSCKALYDSINDCLIKIINAI